jgi:hypothetical protein
MGGHGRVDHDFLKTCRGGNGARGLDVAGSVTAVSYKAAIDGQ